MTAINENTIKYFGSSVTGLFDPNTSRDTKVQNGINLATKALEMIFGAIADAESEANSNINNCEKKNNDLETSAQTQAESNKKAIQTVLDKIEENKNKITEILNKINEFEDEKQEINAEIEIHQKEIQKQKEAYENATTAEDRKKALDAISVANKSIQNLLSRVETLSQQQTDLNEQGEEFQALNGSLETEAQETKSEGESKLEAINAEATVNKAEATALAAHEAKYTLKATEYLTKAILAKSGGGLSSLFTFGIGGVAGEATYAEYMQLYQSNMNAAGIIGNGMSTIFPIIGNIYNGTKTNLGFITNASTTIGSLASASNNDIETFFGISNTIGSWTENTSEWNTTSENIATATEIGYEEVSEETSSAEVNNTQDGDAINNNPEEKKKFNAEVNFNLDMA